ncbi:MAG: acetyl-CoA carboxylase biotin carboxyl carrier protein [Gammaproteobacteria bacterium]|jgi:acetyl-CoA carboxylase biotin carboxyl carrier protein
MSVDTRTVRKLIRLLKEEDIGKIKIQDTDGSIIEVSRSSETILPQTTIATPIQSTQPRVETATTPPKQQPPATTQITQDKHTVNSPMVGTYYASPSPDAKPFVEIGQHVNIGDVLCIVEAMKMFNQIEADRTGKITTILVENGQPVEFEQPLFIIE